jgi:O-antigen ligase
LSLWGAELYLYPDFAPITSVFVNPNQLGSLALVGTITTLVEWQRHGKTATGVILGLNIIGLLLTNYRTAWIALVAALGLLTMYSLWGRKQLVFAAVGGISAFATVLLMTFNIVPGPEPLAELSLKGRRSLWLSSVRALKNKYILGYNFGGVSEVVGNPHNSYLRMFVAFGVGGGLVYLSLVIGTVIGSARRTTTYPGITLVMLLIGFCIVQLFNQLSFVGVSMRSTLIAVGMGYYITGEY